MMRSVGVFLVTFRLIEAALGVAQGVHVISVKNRMSFLPGGTEVTIHLQYDIGVTTFQPSKTIPYLALYYFNESNSSPSNASSVEISRCRDMSIFGFIVRCPMPDISPYFSTTNSSGGPYHGVEPLIDTGPVKSCQPTDIPERRLCYRLKLAEENTKAFKDVQFTVFFDGAVVDLMEYVLIYQNNPKIDNITVNENQARLEIKGSNLAGKIFERRSKYHITISDKLLPCIVNNESCKERCNENLLVCEIDMNQLEDLSEGLKSETVPIEICNGRWQHRSTFTYPLANPPGDINLMAHVVPPTVGFAVLCVGACTLARAWWLRQRKKEKKLVEDGMQLSLFEGSLNLLSPQLRDAIRENYIRSEAIELTPTQLGAGCFGVVRAGVLVATKQAVAVKTLQNILGDEHVKEFYLEALLMLTFDCPFILSAMGIACVNDSPAVVLPLMDLGDLREYVTKNKSWIKDDVVLDFAIQIAKGMQYLHSMRIVHRDLAARNCLLNSEGIVKIADFGLARILDDDDTYCMTSNPRPLPVRSMAPESLLTGAFSSESDIWAFGVLLWELSSRGERPYDDVELAQIKEAVCTEKIRPRNIPVISEELYSIMMECWHEDPAERIQPSKLTETLENLYFNSV